MAMVSLCIIMKLLKSNLLIPKKEHLSCLYIYSEKIKNKWKKKTKEKKKIEKKKPKKINTVAIHSNI